MCGFIDGSPNKGRRNGRERKSKWRWGINTAPYDRKAPINLLVRVSCGWSEDMKVSWSGAVGPVRHPSPSV